MRILESAAALPTWDVAACESVLGQLRQLVPGLRVEWGLAAGEEWCFVSFRDELVAAVRAPMLRAPATRFAFLRLDAAVADKTRAALREANALIAEVDDFDAELFSMEPDDFAEFAGRELPDAEAFDPSSFSANDLIFVTT